jgi:hypothetical protein
VSDPAKTAPEATHYRKMFDAGEYLAAYELLGKDRTLTIKSVSASDLPLAGTSKTERKPVIRFEETPKPLIANKTNARAIAKLYGPLTANWVGRKITIYPTTTRFGSETVECIRVRDKAVSK